MKLSGFRINSESGWRKLLASCISALTVAFVVAMALPATAFADYSNPSVSTVAQMRTDGSLHVVEQRSYDFGEKYASVVWPFTGTSGKQEIEIASVRLIQINDEGSITRDWVALEEVPFQSAWRDFVKETGGIASKVSEAEDRLSRLADSSEAVKLPDGDSYAFDKRQGKLYVFLGATEDSTVVECDYAISNAALVYDDTAEMYWDYIAAQPEVEVSNVQTQIQLPVPEGVEVVPGQTVLAWGHGPQGSVEVRADGTVHYSVPEARPGQYAQAHVLFPREWLTNITVRSKLAKSGTRFDDAVAEEASWADTYSWGKVNGMSVDIGILALCALVLVGSVAVYALWGRERRPEAEACTSAEGVGAEGAGVADTGTGGACATGADMVGAGTEGIGRVGSGAEGVGCVDAAVLGRLLRWDQHSAADFAATLRQLEARGVITISKDDSGKPGGVRFRITPKAKLAKLSPVERGAMKVLFDTVGDGYQSVSLADVQEFCRSNPACAREAMGEWQRGLSAEVRAAKLFDVRSKKASRWLFGIAAAFAALAVWKLTTGEAAIGLAAIATAVAVFAVGYNMPHRTPLGVQLAEAAGDGASAGKGVGTGAGVDVGADEAADAATDAVVGSGVAEGVASMRYAASAPAGEPLEAVSSSWETLLCEAFDGALVA